MTSVSGINGTSVYNPLHLDEASPPSHREEPPAAPRAAASGPLSALGPRSGSDGSAFENADKIIKNNERDEKLSQMIEESKRKLQTTINNNRNTTQMLEAAGRNRG